MNTCKECKHWGVVGTFTLPGREGEIFEYSKPFFTEGYQQCLQLEKNLDQDGEPCAGPAKLGTTGDFGCNLWESK